MLTILDWSPTLLTFPGYNGFESLALKRAMCAAPRGALEATEALSQQLLKEQSTQPML